MRWMSPCGLAWIAWWISRRFWIRTWWTWACPRCSAGGSEPRWRQGSSTHRLLFHSIDSIDTASLNEASACFSTVYTCFSAVFSLHLFFYNCVQTVVAGDDFNRRVKGAKKKEKKWWRVCVYLIFDD